MRRFKDSQFGNSGNDPEKRRKRKRTRKDRLKERLRPKPEIAPFNTQFREECRKAGIPIEQ